MVRTQIVLAGAEEARAPVMTIAMFHEVLAARDGVAARMVRERRGFGAVRALDEGIAAAPLAAWHMLGSAGGLSRIGQ